MLFNLGPSKPAQEVLFSRKKKVQIHPTISLNNIQVERASHHKHLRILLDEKLSFKQHINTAILNIYIYIYIYIYQKQDIYYLTSYISVSSKP